MKPSDWPLRYKVIAIVLFVGSLTAIGLAANAFASALPNIILFPLAVGMMAFAAGYLVGERSATKARLRDEDFERRTSAKIGQHRSRNGTPANIE